MWHSLLLLCAGLLAGTMNAVAGGGSFVGFPAMVLVGLPPIVANASNTVALCPGTFASTWARRHDLRDVAGIGPGVMVPVTLAGGLVGAILLLVTPTSDFDIVIPWLLLATLTFAAGRGLGDWLRQRVTIGPVSFLAIQFVLSIYGGYFGGAVGLMMMAAWSLLDGADLGALAPMRTMMATVANVAAVVCFILAGVVRWPELLTMMVAAIAGGYFGARYARMLPPPVLRWFVVGLSALVTASFFRRMLAG
ncbi:MAG TPA: sulfite exporter TauE/SafE family protein [Rhodopila sp.]|uniref:sulfite exporter TauE/SafE family protein n=1 Tax=Rhodopila sp. TaxID=2480087 RepID=UPI002B6171CE|nr:sulfite exporter TauE/SafE family protein [Rhodopila sp.]HVY13800.1 sulfite exporter TauE/SafE family protein [Rhodopila sp.]